MRRALTAVAGLGAATLAYGSLIERNAFTLRRFTVPVLEPGTAPLRLLHVSDLHITAAQKRKQGWIAGLAALQPDLVINTGDTLSDPRGIPAVMRALEPLFAFPGAFVPGNNDYYAPKPKNPMRYFVAEKTRVHGTPLPWPALATAMGDAGWLDLTHLRATVKVGGTEVALAGLDDPHLRRARYPLIAGAADASAAVRIGVMHSPERRCSPPSPATATTSCSPATPTAARSACRSGRPSSRTAASTCTGPAGCTSGTTGCGSTSARASAPTPTRRCASPAAPRRPCSPWCRGADRFQCGTTARLCWRGCPRWAAGCGAAW